MNLMGVGSGGSSSRQQSWSAAVESVVKKEVMVATSDMTLYYGFLFIEFVVQV